MIGNSYFAPAFTTIFLNLIVNFNYLQLRLNLTTKRNTSKIKKSLPTTTLWFHLNFSRTITSRLSSTFVRVKSNQKIYEMIF